MLVASGVYKSENNTATMPTLEGAHIELWEDRKQANTYTTN